MDSTIFYSWQSDNDPKSTRYFIQDALKKAIKKLNASLDFEEAPRLDQDTNNVPGSPEIFNTILNKIDNCSIFVADLSFVVRTDSKKNIPNPNVLLELGYAFKAVSASRIITVMNETYGTASDGLPFDLAHRRWPIRYNLAPGASANERKEEKLKLVTRLTDAIKAIYLSGAAKPLNELRILECRATLRIRHSSHRSNDAEALIANDGETVCYINNMRLLSDVFDLETVRISFDQNVAYGTTGRGNEAPLRLIAGEMKRVYIRTQELTDQYSGQLPNSVQVYIRLDSDPVTLRLARDGDSSVYMLKNAIDKSAHMRIQ